MKKLLSFLLVMICLQTTMAQAIRKPKPQGQTVQTSGPTAYNKGVIPPNTSLVKNQKYYSGDSRYYLIFQEDGNLVVYKATNTPNKAVWQTGTHGIAMQKCLFQADCNLVLYDYKNKARWNSWTDATNKANKKKGWIKTLIGEGDKFNPKDYGFSYWMTVQNDGNLVVYGGIYPQASSVEWNSESFEKN